MRNRLVLLLGLAVLAAAVGPTPGAARRWVCHPSNHRRRAPRGPALYEQRPHRRGARYDQGLFILSGGVQYRVMQRWAVFGQYQFKPASERFVIRSQKHAFNAGIGYALMHSEETVSTER